MAPQEKPDESVNQPFVNADGEIIWHPELAPHQDCIRMANLTRLSRDLDPAEVEIATTDFWPVAEPARRALRRQNAENLELRAALSFLLHYTQRLLLNPQPMASDRDMEDQRRWLAIRRRWPVDL